LLLTALLLWIWIERQPPLLLQACRAAIDLYRLPTRNIAANLLRAAAADE